MLMSIHRCFTRQYIPLLQFNMAPENQHLETIIFQHPCQNFRCVLYQFHRIHVISILTHTSSCFFNSKLVGKSYLSSHGMLWATVIQVEHSFPGLRRSECHFWASNPTSSCSGPMLTKRPIELHDPYLTKISGWYVWHLRNINQKKTSGKL